MRPEDQRHVWHHHGNRTEQRPKFSRKLEVVSIGTDSQEDGKVWFYNDLRDKTKFYSIYLKIPKISPGAYIFQRPFFKGLIFGGAYQRREICVSKSIWLAL